MFKVKQRSVAELIDKHLAEQHGVEEITRRFRNSVIVRALEKANGNVTHAAKLLRVHRNSIQRWKKFYEVRAQR